MTYMPETRLRAEFLLRNALSFVQGVREPFLHNAKASDSVTARSGAGFDQLRRLTCPVRQLGTALGYASGLGGVSTHPADFCCNLHRRHTERCTWVTFREVNLLPCTNRVG
jgi:hypothetical protein